MDSCIQEKCTEDPNLGLIRNLEFPPLSQQPGDYYETMPCCNPVDQMVLEKCTPIPPGQEEECKVEKELCNCIPDTEMMIAYGVKQVRHSNAITLELKLLLEYEQKILQQVTTRIDKFKALRDENKRKSVEWESEYKAKIPEYDEFTTKLVNVPQPAVLSEEGVPSPVQQKILFQIVSRTINTANRVVVQLSMEEAVANDIDLTLGDLKKHCTVMMKQIQGWLKMLKSQECHQNIVLDRWNEAKIIVKEMKEKSDTVSMGGKSVTNIAHQLKPYEERLKRIEDAICKLCGPPCGTCPGDKGKQKSDPTSQQQNPTPIQEQNPYEERLRRIEEAISNIYQQGTSSPSTPPCDPTRGPSPRPPSEGVSPCPPGSFPPSPFTPGVDCYIDDQYFPSPELQTIDPCVSPPSPPCPEPCQPTPQTVYPEDYFGIPRSPPPPSTEWAGPSLISSQAYSEPMDYDALGDLERRRAPPGTFPGIALVDTPGMGFPVPVAALERGGRPPGQTAPLSPPPSPPPRQMGRFRPVAVSSPVGKDSGILRLREIPSHPPAHPMAGQPVDPALLPKIQGDLQRLGERNKHLQELVCNFKRIRSTLTDEIDKAVRLNQKLQRDLYYVAEAHKQ